MATQYPSEWLDELRARADIASIVSEYVPLKQNGRRYWGLCPFHNEKTASFSVDSDRGFYYCFGCKAGGNVFQFIMDMERMEFGEAVRFLAEKLRIPLPEKIDNAQAQQQRTVRERIYEINRRAAHFFHDTLYGPEGADVLAYLHGRGLDDPAIKSFGLGASPPGWDTLLKTLGTEGFTPEEIIQAGLAVDKGSGKRFDMFRNRAMFPIISAHGAVLGFGGRAMGDAQPKYLNTSDTPAFNKRLNVYAHNMLRKARNLPRVLLVEGYMDVVSLARQGVTGVVATLGTALTPEQAKLLKRYAPEIWVAYDGDSAGQNAILRALDVFEGLDIPARVLVIPDGLDPDDFIRGRGREAFEALTPLSAARYRMLRAKDGLDLSGEEGRTQYAIACASILKKVSQPVEVENLLKRLVVETGYTREVLVQQIGLAPLEKPMHIQAPRREKLPTATPVFLPDHLQAERTLLTLMGAGLVPAGTVDKDRFTDETHRLIAGELLSGQSPSALLESEMDPEVRPVLLEVLGREPRLYDDETMTVITDCLEKMRRGWIDNRILELNGSLKAIDDTNEKKAVLQEIQALNTEKKRLGPGRKE